ncbi:MAG TPA: hypothetical protein VFK06_14305 [Candidatus Angelobacter sp.]|nr:hypothetical protein [Candidatus Angelobacter sp.]
MTRLFCSIVLAFSLLTSVAFTGQVPASRYDPGAQSRGQHQNPFDFSKLFKSTTTDYGRCIEDWRRIAIESSIYEFSFWVNGVTMVALLGCFCWILRLKGERRQLIFSTAQVTAKYQNQLTTGHENYQRLHAVYRQHLEELDREKEPKLALKAPQFRSKNAGDQRETAGDVKDVSVAVVTASPDYTSAANPSAISDAVFQSLRQQITTLTQQLEQERQKNRKLRGE